MKNGSEVLAIFFGISVWATFALVCILWVGKLKNEAKFVIYFS